MLDWLRQLDELLRGDRTRDDLLNKGVIDLRLRRFVPLALILGALYGFFMGWYALFGARPGAIEQAAATIVKLPLLFLLTLAVTFPSLYVFGALAGSRLGFLSTLRLLVGAIVVNLAVAASLGPILGFFTVSTTSYPFMVLLNVALLGIGGAIGLSFLFRALRSLAEAERRRRVERATHEPTPPPVPEPPPIDPNAPSYMVPSPSDPGRPIFTARPTYEPPTDSAAFIFRIWVFIYAMVGAQMGWVLRPFIGSPNLPFEFFRERSGNFFTAVGQSLRALFGW